MKKLIVLGADGYLGFPVSLHFSLKGWEVHAVDNLSKRFIEAKMNIEPAINIIPFKKRFEAWNNSKNNLKKNNIKTHILDIALNSRQLYNLIDEVRPDAIIHFAEQPSAPYSMKGREEAFFTQMNNVSGTLNLIFAVQKFVPDCHILKLGTMGEYGTPNIDIEEGWLDIEHKGRKDKVMFPKKPSSFYHLSKVHDSNNLEFACRVWDLKITDLNQGIVYGAFTPLTKDENLETSFHYDSIFGTVINRFISQAIVGHPLTIYGEGEQVRAYLHIDDVIQCISLALDNPPENGEFKVRNQFTEYKSVKELAILVQNAFNSENSTVEIDYIDNPRVEESKHYFNPINESFQKIGLSPKYIDQKLILEIASYLKPYIRRIDRTVLKPKIKWNFNKK